MIKTFNLPVTEDETLRVVYQKPKGYPEEKEAGAVKKPAQKKPPRSRRHKITEDDLVSKPLRKPAIVMIHGFPGGHKGGCDDLFGELEYRFEGLGYPTIRFDFRGCGESAGKEEDLCLESACQDLNAVLQWAQHDAGHRSVILLGESCGATIAVLGFDPKVVTGMILLWPALKLKETAFQSLFTLESRIESMLKDMPFVNFDGHKLGSHFVNDIYTADLTSALEAISVPTLVQHGTQDEEVPLEQAYFARDTIPGVIDLGIFEGGNHGLRGPTMRQYMFMNIRHFLDRLLKKLDSQAKN
ncbi:MAG: alpha/beta hydrolase [Proteobacteria bacterium]|nr:alpha/beta hydrolase [Pseudomonadota bacterium]